MEYTVGIQGLAAIITTRLGLTAVRAAAQIAERTGCRTEVRYTDGVDSGVLVFEPPAVARATASVDSRATDAAADGR